MSNTVMAFCWPLQLPFSEKAVLIALADAANDDGVCWLAVKSRRADKLDLMVKTCLSERAVQGAIQGLVGRGLVERDERAGRGVIYTLTPPGFLAPTGWNPARAAPPQTLRGADAAGAPADAAGKPSLNRKKKKDPVGSSSSVAPRALKRNLVPDDWEPKDAHREKVKAFGWPDGMIDEQIERFREWEFKDGKTDFDRAFHRWLREANDRLKGRNDDDGYHFAGSGPAPRRRSTPRDERLGAMQRGALAALDRRGR